MDNGLDINLNQFKRMNSKDRDILIYNNLVHIRKNREESTVEIQKIKFHNKLQNYCLFIISAFIGLKRFIGL